MNEEQAEKRWEDRIRDKRMWEAVGRRIRNARIGKGISVEDLSELVNLGPAAIYRLEIGATSTTISRLVEIARVLDLDVAELLGTEEEEAARLRIAFRGRRLTPEQVDELLRFAEERFSDQQEGSSIDTN